MTDVDVEDGMNTVVSVADELEVVEDRWHILSDETKLHIVGNAVHRLRTADERIANGLRERGYYDDE